MEYVRLGSSGIKVSRLCLGCMSFGQSTQNFHGWTLNEESSRPFFRTAIESGINFFDTANIYATGASEEVTGRAIRDFAKREEVVIATKLSGKMRADPNGSGLSRKAVLQEIDDSLRRLGTDYVDLYQIHRFDPNTPVEETLEALHDVVRAGKARYIGASSMHAWQFMKMLGLQRANGWAQFISMQNHYNLLYREEEREMIPLSVSEGVGLMPWSPLARGRLARPWSEATSKRTETDAFNAHFPHAFDQDIDRPIIDCVNKIAGQRNIPAAQVALAWVLQRSGVTSPIIGATKPEHLEDAVATLEVRLDSAEIAELESPYRPRPLVGFS